MKLETFTVKEIRITTETIKLRCADHYKHELVKSLDENDIRTAKEYMDRYISVKTKEHDNDLVHHVTGETEIVLTEDQLNFLRKHKDSHVAVIDERGEHIALFPHRELTY